MPIHRKVVALTCCSSLLIIALWSTRTTSTCSVDAFVLQHHSNNYHSSFVRIGRTSISTSTSTSTTTKSPSFKLLLQPQQRLLATSSLSPSGTKPRASSSQGNEGGVVQEMNEDASSTRRNDPSIATDEKNEKKAEQNEERGGSVVRITWNPLRLLVLRLGLTEPAYVSPLNYGKYDGEFTCAYCGAVLFDSNAKYNSGSGWPSFWRSAKVDSIAYKREFDGRLECQCKSCGSHLGHVFLDGPRAAEVPQTLVEGSPESDPRGKDGTRLPRFCVNGASIRYKERVN